MQKLRKILDYLHTSNQIRNQPRHVSYMNVIMSNSDTDFDDDDDALLQDVLYGRTQVPVISNHQVSPPKQIPIVQPTTQSRPTILEDKVQARLFQADGEIATLRAQLLQLQNQKQKEVTELKESLNAFKHNSEDQVNC